MSIFLLSWVCFVASVNFLCRALKELKLAVRVWFLLPPPPPPPAKCGHACVYDHDYPHTRVYNLYKCVGGSEFEAHSELALVIKLHELTVFFFFFF